MNSPRLPTRAPLLASVALAFSLPALALFLPALVLPLPAQTTAAPPPTSSPAQNSSAQSPSTQDPAIPPTVVHRARPRTPRSDQAAINPNLIVLDPGHGGADSGASFPSNVLEKDVTVAFAGRLRTLLAAQGFTVVLTHESPSDDLSPDQRVELANRAHPVACLLLHAASAGHGLHLYTSSLAPAPAVADPQAIIPWDTAQAAFVPQSQRLAAELSAALSSLRIPMVTGQASMRPIDSLSCPSVTLEFAPLNSDSSITDSGYQARIAQSLATALTFWRGHTQSALQAAAAAAAAAQGTATPGAPAAIKPVPRPRPKPVTPPVNAPIEVPDEGPLSAPVKPPPAPIIRRSPPASTPPASTPAAAPPQLPEALLP